MSGRIADIAIHPHHENTRYVAVGSGGYGKLSRDDSGFNGIVVQRFWLPGCSARFEGLRVYLRWEQIGKSILDQREEITLYE